MFFKNLWLFIKITETNSMKRPVFAKYAMLVILIAFYGYLHAQTSEIKWDFPVKPGMPEWKKFSSNSEMVQACQIPIELLSTITLRSY
jgi:hypothetical protein